MTSRGSISLSAAMALAVLVAGCGEDRVRDLPSEYGEHLEEYRQKAPVEQPALEAPGEPDEPARTPGPGEPGTAEPAFEGTAGSLEAGSDLRAAARIESVRAARNPGFDRVVIEFEGDAAPGFHAEYVDRPIRRCETGEVVAVPGDGWLAVRLTPAAAHETRRGRRGETIPDPDQRLELPVVAALVLTCDRDDAVEWVIGVRSPNPYRVLSLRGPGRIVVDVLH